MPRLDTRLRLMVRDRLTRATGPQLMAVWQALRLAYAKNSWPEDAAEREAGRRLLVGLERAYDQLRKEKIPLFPKQREGKKR